MSGGSRTGCGVVTTSVDRSRQTRAMFGAFLAEARRLIVNAVLDVSADPGPFLLTSETSVDRIVAHARRTRTTAVQIVDWVDPEDHREIRRRLPGVKLVQVVHVVDEDSLEQARIAAGAVDALLLDSGRTGAVWSNGGGHGAQGESAELGLLVQDRTPERDANHWQVRLDALRKQGAPFSRPRRARSRELH